MSPDIAPVCRKSRQEARTEETPGSEKMLKIEPAKGCGGREYRKKLPYGLLVCLDLLDRTAVAVSITNMDLR